MKKCLITGGTGLLGSHIAELLVGRAERVRAIVRPTSNVEFLKSLGVDLVVGDLTQKDFLAQAMDGVDWVFHCASKVGDWGTWEEFQRDTIESTENVLAASKTAGVGRLIAVSSTSAYGHPPRGAGPVTEDWPLGKDFWIWDYYTQAKVETEKRIWKSVRDHNLPVTVIRPSWIYGPRDRTSIFRMEKNLRTRMVIIVGRGNNPISSVYAGNVAEACILAAQNPLAQGQAYNITQDGFITQREYIHLFADHLGLPHPLVLAPYYLAYHWAFSVEVFWRLLGMRTPPWVTRYIVWLLGRHTIYSTAKAETELGWKPTVGYDEGIRRTAHWFYHERT